MIPQFFFFQRWFGIPLTLFMSVLFTTPAQAYNFKARAREHFESHHVKGENFSEKYLGLNNTVNLWWEKPYDHSFGFSISPIIAGLRAEDMNSALGKRITFINYGLEYKFFLPKISPSLFTRLGYGYSKLEPLSGGKNFEGTNYYVGFGYEIPMNKFGLALEMAGRKAYLEESVTVESLTPSIGFHFYKSL